MINVWLSKCIFYIFIYTRKAQRRGFTNSPLSLPHSSLIFYHFSTILSSNFNTFSPFSSHPLLTPLFTLKCTPTSTPYNPSKIIGSQYIWEPIFYLLKCIKNICTETILNSTTNYTIILIFTINHIVFLFKFIPMVDMNFCMITIFNRKY